MGGWWAHARWGLEVPPDMVVFSKKYQVAGLWTHAKYAPRPEDEDAFHLNSTWGGDAWRSQLLSTIVDTVEADDLFERSVRAGELLFDGLRTLPGLRNVRNVGGFGAFDVDDRDQSIARLQEEGILVTGCGVDHSIRIRPALVFDESDVPTTLERMERALG